VLFANFMGRRSTGYHNVRYFAFSPAAMRYSGRVVGNPSIILSPSAKLGLDADPVIDRGLNSLLAPKIAFGGLH
jgi:hypothetical protein